MKKIYAILSAVFISALHVNAQPVNLNTGLTGNTTIGGRTVTFAVQNTNGYSIAITDVNDYHNTALNGAAYTLWYTTSALTGAPTIDTPVWVQVATGPAISNVNTGDTTVISGLNLVIPAGTTYRMALVHDNTSANIYYAGSGNNSYSAAGVDLLTGSSAVSPTYVGAFPSPTTNPRYFAGGVTFMRPGPICPTAGNLAASNIISSAAMLSWGTSAGDYEYFVDQKSAVGFPVTSTPTTATSAYVTGLMPSTTYYLHVRNRCTADNASDWETLAFSTMPECKVPRGFRVSNLTPTSATIGWNALAAAMTCEYVVDENATDPSGTIAPKNTSANSFNDSSLKENTKYYVHIRSNCANGEQSAWSLDSFVTPIPCRAANVKIDHVNTTKAVAYWDPVPSAVNYDYAVTKSPIAPSVGTAYNFTSLLVSALASGENYYVHVRCRCNSLGYESISPWSNAGFRTFPTSVNDLNDNTIGIEAYPNPVVDVLTLNISGNGAETATIQLSDITGKAIRTIEVKDNKMDINVSELAKGAYLLKYVSQTGIKTLRFTKQ